MAKACIICAKEVQHGRPVADDAVIAGIRAVKRRLGIARNNTLVVCAQCEEGYRKRRAEYEKKLVQHVVIASVVMLAFILLPIFTTGFSLWSLVLGLLFAAGVMLMSVFSHCPKAEGLGNAQAAAPGAKEGTAQKAQGARQEAQEAGRAKQGLRQGWRGASEKSAHAAKKKGGK